MAVQSETLVAYLKAQDAGMTSTLGKVGAAMQKMSGQSAKASQGFMSKVKNIALATGIFKAVSAGIKIATGQIGAAFTRMDTMDNFQRNMTRITGSSQKASGVLEELKGATKGTAYGLNSVANATQSFANSAIPLKKTTQYAKDWMDAISAYGDGTTDTYDSVMLQLNQMASKGKANLGDLKSAMEAGVPVLQILAAQSGKTAQQVSDELSSGKVSAEEFMDAMHKAFTNGAGDFKSIAGAAKQAGNTWKGTFDNMKAAVTRGIVAMIENFDKMAKAFTGSSIKEWVAEFGKFMEDNLGKIGEFFGAVVQKLVPFKDAFLDAFSGVGEAVMEAVKAVMLSLKGMSASFGNAAQVSSFKDIMDAIARSIVKVANFIRENSDAIAFWIVELAKGAAAWKVFQAAMGVGADIAKGIDKISKFKDKVRELNVALSSRYVPALSSAGSAASAFGARTKTAFQSMRADGIGVVTSALAAFRMGITQSNSTLSLFSRNIAASKLQMRALGDGNALTRPFRAFSSAIELTFPKMGRFNNSLRTFGRNTKHPISGLRNLSSAAGKSGGAISGAGVLIGRSGTAIGRGFKTMASAGISAIRGLSAAMLSNPITAILLAISLAVAGLVVAWRKNFGNIQGVVKSFGSVIKNSFKSLIPMFEGAGKALKPLFPILKDIAMVAGGALATALAVVVDAFRLIVTTVASVIQGIMALGSAIKMVVKFLKGDMKGAAEEFDNVKGKIDKIADNYESFGKNSAVKGLFTETAKEIDKTTDKAEKGVGKVSKAVRALGETTTDVGADFEDLKQKIDEAFNAEDQAEKNKAFAETNKELFKTYSENWDKIAEKGKEFNETLDKMDKDDAKGRKNLTIQSMTERMKLITDNNKNLLAQEKTNSEMLRMNRDADGQKLSEQQRRYLTEENQMIREKLLEANDEYMKAAEERLRFNDELSQEEIEQTINTLGESYSMRMEAIQENEARVKELQDTIAKSKSEAEKQQARNEISALNEKNAQMREAQNDAGVQMLEILNQNGQLNAASVLEGMTRMKITTNDQITQIVQSFASFGASTEEQLGLVAGIMGQKGVEGADLLAQGIQNHDFSSIPEHIRNQIAGGLQQLPPAMFKGGNEGKLEFIGAIKAGDYKAAAKTMPDGVEAALDKGKGPIKNTTDQVIEDSVKAPFKKKKGDFKKVGEASGDQINAGLESKKEKLKRTGKKVAKKAKAGAKEVKFESVGKGIGDGMAAGFDGQPLIDKVKAAAETAKAEAKKVLQINSPSRWFRKVIGRSIGLGMALGVDDEIGNVVGSMRNLVESVKNVAEGSGVGSIFENGRRGIDVSVNDGFMGRLEKALQKFVDSHASVVLDSGKTVGALGPQINRSLGSMTERDERNSW